jgi:uncharacterized protein (TIGR02145 family)
MKIKFQVQFFIILSVAIAIMAACKKDETSNANTIKDADGNVYHTVIIGGKEWMVENLKTTHFRDGSEIPNVTDNSEWMALTSAALCSYGNSADNLATYGCLYNWYAVNDSRNICPIGWHIPSDAEWKSLCDSLGGTSLAGGKLKESGTSHWNSPNIEATNESGFTALPGGNRNVSGGFSNSGALGMFLSATEENSTNAWYYYVRASNTVVTKINNNKGFGASVRCVKD